MKRILGAAALLALTTGCFTRGVVGGRDTGSTGSGFSSSSDTGEASDGYQSADMEGDARCYEKELRNDGVDGTPALNDYLDPFFVTGTTGTGSALAMRVTHDWTDPWSPYALDHDGECWDAKKVHVFMGIEENDSSRYAWYSADVFALPTNVDTIGIASATRIEQSDWPWGLPSDAEPGSTGTMSMTMTPSTVTISVRGTDGTQWLTIEAPRP